MNRALLVLTVALLGASAAPSDAQRTRCWRMRDGRMVRCEHDSHRGRRRHVREPVELGVRGGYDFDADAGTFGGQLRIPVAGPVALVPSLDVSLDRAGPPWQANADVVVRPDRLAGLYAGVGAGFVHLEDPLDGDHDTEVGLNLLAGLDGGRLAGTRLRPFAEGRWTRIDDDRDAFRLVAGVSVPVAGR
jgi:hypothetical protein